MLKNIQKEVEDLRVKVYSGQSNEDTEKALYEVEQLLFKAMDKQLILSGVVTSKRDETLELLEEIIIKVKEADNEVENGIYDPMLECAKNILNNYVIKRR